MAAQERTPYKLAASEVEAALSALGRASQSFALTPREEALYRALGRCLKASAAFLAIALVLVFGDIAFDKGENDTVMMLIGFDIMAFVVSAFLAPILFVINAGATTRLLRQRRLLLRKGFRSASLAAWNATDAASRRSTFLGTAGPILGTLVVVLGVAMLIDGFTHRSVWIALAGLGVIGLPLTYFFFTLVERSRQLVAKTNHLMEGLRSAQSSASSGSAQMDVSPEVLEQAARIERVHIARERELAVIESAGQSAGYSIQIPREVMAQRSSLSPSRRLALEELMEAITADPRIGKSATPAATPTIFEAASGELRVEYAIDEPGRRIRIKAVHAAAEDPNA